MKLFTRWFMIVCMLTFIALGALADDRDKKTVVTFSVPVEVPGVGAQVLPPGTYVFRIMDYMANRHIVQILNADETHVYTTILAIPNYRLRYTDQTVMTFRERAQGEPQAIRSWFYPGRQWGEEFVYPKWKAVELAKVANEPVLYTTIETPTVEALKTAPIEAVKPTGETVPVAEVVQAPPAEVAAVTMPQTASYLPLLALLGVFSLAAGGLLRKYSA
jgi:hypothetical protein